jgi:hypothetical protein
MGELVAFCKLASGTRRFAMFAETRGDCGTATAAMRGGAQRVVGCVSGGGGSELDS